MKEAEVRHRVLIVDDEESMRLLLARALSNDLGVEPQLAGTCEQALQLVATHAYDAILLDLLMPGIGGVGVLVAVRAPSSPNAHTPVIIVSVLNDKETQQRCLAAGANAYHTKPVRRAELVALVKAQLAARRKPRSLPK